MADTKIQWATKVWNPVTGCTKISEGCKNCYAEKFANRMKSHPNPKIAYKYRYGFEVIHHFDSLKEPYQWKKPQRIFVCSMGDLFHEHVLFSHIMEIMTVIRENSHHTFMILTKRPEIMVKFFTVYAGWLNLKHHLPNLWLGVTAENQQIADERIPVLLTIPAAIRFVSIEPMLGPIDFSLVSFKKFQKWVNSNQTLYSLDWVICGGETGNNARAMNYQWVIDLRKECRDAQIPFFFKQWGEYIPWKPVHGENKRVWFPGVQNNPFTKVGKKKAGCLIDGEEVKQFPNP